MAAPAPTASSTRAPPTQAQNQASSANSTTGKPPGLLAQMASTAGGVAIGSTIGHGLSNMLFGSSASEAPAQQQAAPAQQVNCEFQAREFTKCLDHADMQSCSYYLEQLKAVSSFLAVLFLVDCVNSVPEDGFRILISQDECMATEVQLLHTCF